MMRAILKVLHLWLGGNGASEAKRLAALAGAAGVLVLSSVLTANLSLAVAVFLALQSEVAPAWAAVLAAAATLLLASLLVATIYWLSGRAQRRANRAAAANVSAKAEDAMLYGTLAAAFFSGLASGMDRRQRRPRNDPA
jgi:hypothetical protein